MRSMSVDACALMFPEFGRTAAKRAPLYARLSAGIATDDELASLLLTAPVTQRQPVLLFACVHALLLDGHNDPLARHYPNLTADPDRSDPLPAFRTFCRSNRREIEHLLRTRSTQTNEIGRCALLLPAFGLVAAEVGGIAHLDVGTSAGLNLLLPRYRYRYEPQDGGGKPRDVGAASPVILAGGTRGDVPIPTSIPDVVASRGIDRTPIDVHDADQARWLEACVWPDQIDRFERLRAALELARTTALDVRTGDAVSDVGAQVEELANIGHAVVTNTWVLNYLTGEQRRNYVDALDTVGSRIDLSWIYAESPFLTPELPGPSDPASVDRTVLVLVRWRGGRRSVDHLADCHPHGYWIHWRQAILWKIHRQI
jgi:hypothetical protein